MPPPIFENEATRIEFGGAVRLFFRPLAPLRPLQAALLGMIPQEYDKDYHLVGGGWEYVFKCLPHAVRWARMR